MISVVIKRDMDLIRQILLTAEAYPSGFASHRCFTSGPIIGFPTNRSSDNRMLFIFGLVLAFFTTILLPRFIFEVIC